MEALKVSDTNMVVYLHPSNSDKAYQAVVRELSSLLFKFNEIFDGVVLAYEFNILDKNARTLSGIHPYFGVRLKAKLLLFSPKPNTLLEGKVVKLTQGSIHVIILGFASAIITDKDIREEFKHEAKHGEEVFVNRFHKRHVIKVGTMIRFLVKSLDEEILHISGSLLPSHTGSIRWLDRHMEDVSLADRSNKKRSENKVESVMQEPGTAYAEAYSVNYDHYIRKSKKHKIEKSREDCCGVFA